MVQLSGTWTWLSQRFRILGFKGLGFWGLKGLRFCGFKGFGVLGFRG